MSLLPEQQKPPPSAPDPAAANHRERGDMLEIKFVKTFTNMPHKGHSYFIDPSPRFVTTPPSGVLFLFCTHHLCANWLNDITHVTRQCLCSEYFGFFFFYSGTKRDAMFNMVSKPSCYLFIFIHSHSAVFIYLLTLNCFVDLYAVENKT